MNWLARLKDENAHGPTLQNLQKHGEGENAMPTKPTKPTKDTFVGFVGTPARHIQKIADGAGQASEPVAAELALLGELDRAPAAAPSITTSARLEIFLDRGLTRVEALALAGRLALRDQQRDDRRVCLECAHLSGWIKARRCDGWRKTGMPGPATPADLVDILQRCRGFAHVLKQMAPPGVPRTSKRLELPCNRNTHRTKPNSS